MPRKPDYSQVWTKEDSAEKIAMADAVWRDIVTHLKSLGLVNPSILRKADRYVRLSVEYHFLYPKAAEEGPTKKGKKGGEYANMSWSVLLRLHEYLMKLEVALKIDPDEENSKAKKIPTGNKKNEFLD